MPMRQPALPAVVRHPLPQRCRCRVVAQRRAARLMRANASAGRFPPAAFRPRWRFPCTETAVGQLLRQLLRHRQQSLPIDLLRTVTAGSL